jgi:hypothetical protein
MAMSIIIQDEHGKQVEISVEFDDDKKWEEKCYQVGCEVAREMAKLWMKATDERLFQEKDKDMGSECFRKRIRVTRFGAFSVRRRLYKDKGGNSHFLLDEYLNWEPYKHSTPSLRESLVALATRVTFRDVYNALENLTAGVLCVSTIHQVLQEVSQKAIQSERREWEDCFQHGKYPAAGECRAPFLYTEADGVHLHLQQEKNEHGEKRKHYELKSGIAYDGWERLSQTQERYGLVNKRVYCHSDSSMPFWDGAGLVWHKHWDLGYTKLIVLNGDDANWIDSGTDAMGFCVRQLNGFHLARSCRRGWEQGKEIYDIIRSGAMWTGESTERTGKTAETARDYVLKRLKKGVDWRKKLAEIGTELASEIPDDARGLGAMEGNISNLFADRMKDRGMSWTIKGAQNMGKAIQLSFNGDLGKWCGARPSGGGERIRKQQDRPSFDLFESQSDPHARGHLPALVGPHASRHWVTALRNMTAN